MRIRGPKIFRDAGGPEPPKLMDVADPLEKHARPHICFHTEFGGSKSNRMDVSGGSQFWGYAAPRPLGMGHGRPPRNTLLHRLCYHAKYGNSRSNRIGAYGDPA